MIFIYSLAIITILSLGFTSSIKTRYSIYYSLAAFISILISIYEILRLLSNAKLSGLILSIEKAFMHGNVAVSFFILVMFAGALNTKWNITRKLFSIRAQLAILGSIFILPHGILYLVRFFVLKLPNILSGKTNSTLYLIYMAVGLTAFVILIPLFITSFKKVRTKMNALQWKKLQRWAYPFYFLSYIHILIVLLNDEKIDLLRLIGYTVIFTSYSVLKLLKQLEINKIRVKNSSSYSR
ncbi:ferric reductase-like transmembrane domain-containing protein [Clostridium pasteurianum]|jgi:DMSO/TMAO reductase YedYZ heme-binding membrane subunit|uniref:ferric reductase-like transmembrane domain-containing protein n=1 Tax=Clostridium pasteurianum TaxID=1501 RepID=UPI002260F852|nr:ferric reductase-like transmembrane domain-containing protein [Clostridium pasteurianum]UZW14840.1 ferric reductase-like transmembrane domain-containing protein [Clostridium pasteurianum]